MSIPLSRRFADAVPEMAIPWAADDAPSPRLLVLNDLLAVDLGLDPDWLRSPDGVRFLVGRHLPKGATPVAQAYAGHQFGNYSPRLGDGRALLLGELVHADGLPRDLHLKGSGRTPFSRGGDGFAAVGPMLREYVVSEAMHALGIPTTRSLAVVATGREIRRETMLPGAVLARVAGSHLRVGSFQYARATDDVDLLRRLADHAIARHHPAAADAENPYLALFDAVVAAQSSLVARWMLVGFVHGVMNTDNVTICGETIDYGPCAFMEAYDPAAVFSSIDHGGRYAYGNQPGITGWNLARLAESLLPLFADDQDRAIALAVDALGAFPGLYENAVTAGTHAKLGLPPGIDAGTLVEDLRTILRDNHVDHTSFHRRLATGAARDLVLDLAAIDGWLARWRALSPDTDAMRLVNPAYVPRNHLVEQALAAAVDGDNTPLTRLLDAVTDPFAETGDRAELAEPAPAGSGAYQTFCGT